MIKEIIQEKANACFEEVIAIRKHLHAHPELSFNEHETSLFIQQKLTEYGVSFSANWVETGVVAIIEGFNKTKKTIALRADMDALPIQEENEKLYKSCTPGVMHACGHDVHVACLLGVAKILHELKNEFEGTIKLVFQPAEERFPGGAKGMIDEGVLENPTVQFMLGQHVMTNIDSGKIGIRSGVIMASADEIYFNIIGVGGHAATPDLTINPVPVASQIIVELMNYVEQHKPTDTPTILSFGKFIANGSMNVVPSEVSIAGTFRAFNEEWRNQMLHEIETRSNEISKKYNCICETKINRGYPFTVNDAQLTKRTRQHAIDYLGDENVLEVDIRLTSEDFAYYAQRVPSCFYRLGVRNESKGITSNLHTPTFDVDEDAIKVGVGLMAWLAIQEITCSY